MTWTQNQKRLADRMAEPAMGTVLGFPDAQPKRAFRLQDPTLVTALIFEVYRNMLAYLRLISRFNKWCLVRR